MEVKFGKYINCYNTSATNEFKSAFYEYIKTKAPDCDKIVVLCIGTDRATGDSLGPLIGYKLSRQRGFKKVIRIFGTLESPVHAKNLDETIKKIYEIYNNPLVIAIDACLGRTDYIGYLTIDNGSIKPGAGVRKNLTAVGDIAITGIVNHSGSIDITVLQNTRLGVVMKMADVIAGGIYGGLKLLFDNSEITS